MEHFTNDNTSPETLSFHVVPFRSETGFGLALARETSRRFLLSQLLVEYSNRKFALSESGQRAMIYFSPHPPSKQKTLNNCISDSFYRELFMSPCLSGWDRGEEKHAYMCLCHEVLSRSQLNASIKLKDAGIITRDLVVLPNLSNMSLANNGIHVSVGSMKLTELIKDKTSLFGNIEEKYIGDLVTKIMEHFLPLFVGSYSADPYRLDYSDFHPERVLGFLPHELDFTHLRMMWRRWKRKATIQIFGRSCTPFGVKWVDRLFSRMFRLRGDFVIDFRLIDYPVCLMSTERSPAFDGSLFNWDRLRDDFAALGIFHPKMSPYFLIRLREFSKAGFSGFEARHYSLFPSLKNDMSQAVNLQVLITCLAFKYVLQGKANHWTIPDNPFVESERRQIFFGSAIGIPTFYVRSDTSNKFLRRLVERTKSVRYSRRYPGYLRVYNRLFKLALLETIRQDGQDLVEAFGLQGTLCDLEDRLKDHKHSAAADRLMSGINNFLNGSPPINSDAEKFNLEIEGYYRDVLRLEHAEEAFTELESDINILERHPTNSDAAHRAALAEILKGSSSTSEIVKVARACLIGTKSTISELRRCILLILLLISWESTRYQSMLDDGEGSDVWSARIC